MHLVQGMVGARKLVPHKKQTKITKIYSFHLFFLQLLYLYVKLMSKLVVLLQCTSGRELNLCNQFQIEYLRKVTNIDQSQFPVTLVNKYFELHFRRVDHSAGLEEHYHSNYQTVTIFTLGSRQFYRLRQLFEKYV